MGVIFFMPVHYHLAGAILLVNNVPILHVEARIRFLLKRNGVWWVSIFLFPQRTRAKQLRRVEERVLLMSDQRAKNGSRERERRS